MRKKHIKIGTTDQGAYHSLSNAKYGLALRARDMWDVEAGAEYSNTRNTGQGQKCWVFIRTYKGKGVIHLISGKKHECLESTCLIINDIDIVKYHNTSGKINWAFSWIVFECEQDLSKSIICNEVLRLPIEPEEESMAEEIRENIEDPFSSALAGTALSRWILRIDRRHRQTMTEKKTNRIVHLACAWLSRNPQVYPNVEKLAKECFVSSRYLQASFQEILQCSPKSFLEKRVLSRAMNRLMFTSDSLLEISEDLGFSSVFHMSGRFKKHYGYPPSKVRKTQ